MRFIFSAIKRLLKAIIKLSLYLAIIATIIVLIPNLPPYTKFTTINVSPMQPRVGPLATNGALNNAGKAYNGKLLGPEAFQVYKGELYTSLATGEIVKLTPEGHVTFVTSVGQPCSGSIIHEHICGRPLGFVIDERTETLYVADAYHGIWKVDLKSNKKQLLVSPRVEIEKRKPKLFNFITLAKNGDLYWTDSTSDFHLKDGAISMLTDPSGRLFHYDAARNQSKVLVDNLWFANGVALSPDNDFLVVAESSNTKLTKYYLNGPKKGKSEVFVDGLPGVPDNVRALPDGSGVLVALYTVFEEGRTPLTHLLAPAPLARKFLARLQRLLEIPFEYLNTLYPHIVFEEIVYTIGHFKTISGLTPPTSGLLVVDWNGNIVAAYYNTDGSLGHVSDAIVFNNKLHTGSPHLQTFVGTVPVPPLLKKAFETSKKPEAPKVEKKTQQAEPDQKAPTKKTEEKPKAKVEVPKAEIKSKVEEKTQATPKPAEQANVKKDAPKVAKPAVEPKPTQQNKPAQQEKVPPPAPKTTPPPKPSVAKQPADKDTKPEPKIKAKPEVNPTPPPKQAEKTTPPPKPSEKTTPPPKPSQKATQPPKPTTPSPKPAPKVKEATKEAPKKAQPVKQDTPKSAEDKPKPIREEIPSDTIKPTKEKLKVIRKDGPAEIHVPNQ
ncbi:protein STRICTOSIDINE SYNTHASE-LIKE 7 [Helicoverpa zea]|uniref:protein STRICTOSIDINE SYNTHASE-LIKE 7 n=1 Tax=Helicoverpa zea TaxID=7113 RepID=UPI001F596BD7|nr:protein STRICTOSIDINE SYNTHASE-LIKE 7 [Helicoverpa zea]XP_047033398.1 protein STRICTOSIDINE SYNTHASE-LIKE 7 [Helicoverpa zea]